MDLQFDVFVSYRRDGGSELAHLLHNGLAHRGYRVFMDVRDLKSGRFDTALEQAIERAKDLVVVLTPGALDRCHEHDDWLRREIRHGFVKGVNIVPVMVADFKMSPAAEMPSDIAALAAQQAILYVHEHCEACIDKIAELLHSRPRFYILQSLSAFGDLAGLLSLPISIGSLFNRAHSNTADTEDLRQAELEVLKERITSMQTICKVKQARFEAGVARLDEAASARYDLALAQAELALVADDGRALLEHLHAAEKEAQKVLECAQARLNVGVATGDEVETASLLLKDVRLALIRTKRGLPTVPSPTKSIPTFPRFNFTNMERPPTPPS